MTGMGRLVGGRCKFWNAGLSVGTDYFLAFTALECIGIILMASCLAEMAGALPFTGMLCLLDMHVIIFTIYIPNYSITRRDFRVRKRYLRSLPGIHGCSLGSSD